MKLSACGLNCDECQFYPKECAGCYAVNGKPFWTAEATSTGICPLFDCAINQKGFSNCGDCVDLPCKIFMDLKDPSISAAEHQKSIRLRVKNLR
jgi:hypothetical protein